MRATQHVKRTLFDGIKDAKGSWTCAAVLAGPFRVAGRSTRLVGAVVARSAISTPATAAAVASGMAWRARGPQACSIGSSAGRAGSAGDSGGRQQPTQPHVEPDVAATAWSPRRPRG